MRTNFKYWFTKLIASLGGKITALLTFALLFTLAAIAYNDYSISAIATQNVNLLNFRKNIVALNDLRTSLFRAESAQRGFLLVHRPEYLMPFELALKDAKDNLNYLILISSKTTKTPETEQELIWINDIGASVKSRITEMQLTIDLAHQGKFEEAENIINLDSGLKEMTHFLKLTQTITDNQSQKFYSLLANRDKNMRETRFSLIFCSILLVLMVAIVIKQLLKEIVANNILQQRLQDEKKITEHKLKEQSIKLNNLAFDYLTDVESERHQLARELHDEIGAILTATKMDLAWVMKKSNEDLPEVYQKLVKTNSYLDQGIDLKRRIVEKLHPSVISNLGFWPALQLLIDDTVERNHWQLSLITPDDKPKINETISLITYRVVQETLNNASKYAKASTISIDIMVDEKMLKCDIRDNGVGFNVGDLIIKKHGLAGMRHRVISIGGHFEIVSAPNQGTITTVLLPIHKLQ